jgi:hypothetical protein
VAMNVSFILLYTYTAAPLPLFGIVLPILSPHTGHCVFRESTQIASVSAATR